jgi:protein-S-isoprenylcysteine O-methyltransferase Ste14
MPFEAMFAQGCIVFALSVFVPGFLFGFSNSNGSQYYRLVMGSFVVLAFSIGTYRAWRTTVPGLLDLTGGCILITASLLFLKARFAHHTSPHKAFSHEPPPQLVLHGPYRYVRHPIYTSYILGLIGMLLLAPDWFLLAVALALIGMYAWAAFQEEKCISNSIHNEVYKAYVEQTGFLIPKLNLFKTSRNSPAFQQNNNEVTVDNPSNS